MKTRVDLVRGWLRKAASDLVAMEASLTAGALDAACFHAQQALHHEKDFPHTHNLSRLIERCEEVDDSFRSLRPLGASLTPYAVELRYDDEFWPIRQVAEEARSAALAVREFVRSRLPEAIVQGLI